MGIKTVREAVKEQFLRDIDRQCQNLCLEKKGTPSVLNVRQDSCVEALTNFSWEKVMVEMRDRSPDVLDVLATISKQPSVSHVPAVCFSFDVSEKFQVGHASEAADNFAWVWWMQSQGAYTIVYAI